MPMNQVPQGQGNSVNNSQAAGDQGAAAEGGVQAQASAGAQEVPKLSEISDTTYYMIDPNKPNERVLGTQLREALHRAKQVDNMQSNLHKTQAERDQLRDKLQNTDLELKQLQEQVRIQEQLKALGYSQAQPNKQVSDYNNTDEYLFNEQQQQPDSQQQQQQQGVDVASPDFFRKIQDMINESVGKAFEPVQQQIHSVTAEGLSDYQQERQTQDTIFRAIQQHEEQQAQDLRSMGAAETEIQRILDMERTATIKARAAEELLGATGPERDNSVSLGAIRWGEADNLRAEAMKARLAIAMAYEKTKPQAEAQQMLETGAYAEPILEGLSTDPEEARKFKQEDIDADRKEKLKRAKQLAAEQNRYMQATGSRPGI